MVKKGICKKWRHFATIHTTFTTLYQFSTKIKTNVLWQFSKCSFEEIFTQRLTHLLTYGISNILKTCFELTFTVLPVPIKGTSFENLKYVTILYYYIFKKKITRKLKLLGNIGDTVGKQDFLMYFVWSRICFVHSFSNFYIDWTAKFNDASCFHFLFPYYWIWFTMGYFCCCVYV